MASLLEVAAGRAATSEPDRRRARGIVRALAVTQTVGYGTLYYAFAVFLVPTAGDLRASTGAITGAFTGAITGAFTASVLTSAALAVPVGRWLDRRGGRALMTGGSLLGAVMLAAWSQVHALWQLYLVQVGIGIAAAASLYEAAFAVIIAWHAPRRRSTALLTSTVVAGFASPRPAVSGHGRRDSRRRGQHAYHRRHRPAHRGRHGVGLPPPRHPERVARRPPARLADATAAGCEVAVITVQPGSKSQQNAQRHGFDLLYTRAVLVAGS